MTSLVHMGTLILKDCASIFYFHRFENLPLAYVRTLPSDAVEVANRTDSKCVTLHHDREDPNHSVLLRMMQSYDNSVTDQSR